MGIIADGQSSSIYKFDSNFISDVHAVANNLVSTTPTPTPIPEIVGASYNGLLNITRFGEFLMGHAQILATIVAVGFSIYTFVLGMKVSRLALKLILKKEKVIQKFGVSLVLVGILSLISILSFEKLSNNLVYLLYLLTIVAYALPAYWLVKLSQSLSSYLSPNSVMILIKDSLLRSVTKGFEVETGQLSIQKSFEEACEKAGIEYIPGWASLYEGDSQVAIHPNKQGYICGFDQAKIEKIGQLLIPLVTSEDITEETPSEPSQTQKKKVRIFQGIGSYIDPSSNNQSLNTVASVDVGIANSDEITKILNSLFTVSTRDKFAIEINDQLVDLKNHILSILGDKNLDEYKDNILIFPALLKAHYDQPNNENNKYSLSYLNPIREIVSELLQKTLQTKDPVWVGSTIPLVYTVLYQSMENDDYALFQQFVTLFKTIYSLGRKYQLKESLWTSHHLFYELLNYHLIPKLEKELKKSTEVEIRKKAVTNAKTFIWSMFVTLSENLKLAYQNGDAAYTNSVIKMLKGSLKYLGENEDVEELVELKEWYKEAMIKLWFNQLGYAFVLYDKRNQKQKPVFDLILSATNENSIEEMSSVAGRDKVKGDGNFGFPDFMEVMFDEESDYSGSAVFMGDPYISNFKAYVTSSIVKSDLNGQKSVPISQYYLDELKKVAEAFRGGSYSDLIGSIDGAKVDAFNQINLTAFNEYQTQTEQSIIDAALDQNLIKRFVDNVYRGWNGMDSFRFLINKHSKVQKKLKECPKAEGGIMLHGFNQRHSKEYFIAQDRFGYPRDYGYEYGKAISEGEDKVIYEALLKAVKHISISVNGKSAEEILNKVLSNSKVQKDTIMVVPFDFWEFHYRNSEHFTPKYSLEPSDPLKDLRSFIGYYEFEGTKVPMIYSPLRIRKDNKLVVANIGYVGKLTIYKPHEEAQAGKEIFADIRSFNETEVQQIIDANPSDLSNLSEGDKKRKLAQEVAFRALERYSYEVVDSDMVKVFKLEGIVNA